MQVSIDGQATTFSAGAGGLASALHPKILLYFANNLGPASHTVVVTNPGQQQGTGPFIDLDAITVFSTTAPNATASSSTAIPSSQAGSNNQSSSSSQSQSTRHVTSNSDMVIIGAVVGSVVGLLLILALLFFLFRRQRNRRTPRSPSPMTPENAELPMQGANIIRTPVSPMQPTPFFLEKDSRHSIAPSYYDSAAAYAPATPFPPSRAPSINYALPSRARTLSGRSVIPRVPSLRTITPSHSRVQSSTSDLSTTPMMSQSNVPIIRVPKPPLAALARQGYDPNKIINVGPIRPSTRPPSLNL